MAKEEKGTALLKRVKIDKAQRNMFIAVCISSIIVGVSLVASVWFVRKIKFNKKIISQSDKVITDLKSSISNLAALKMNVADLTSNENLEVVAREKDKKNGGVSKYCEKYINAEINNEEGVKDVEMARTCSALRLIPDALPSVENQEATFGSFETLIMNNLSYDNLSANSGSSYSAYTSDSTNVTDTVHTISANLTAVDTQTRIYNGLSSIERSIRNYDISNITITWTDETRSDDGIELNATFDAYYADEVVPSVKTRRICADKTNKVCLGQGGDESVGE